MKNTQIPIILLLSLTFLRLGYGQVKPAGAQPAKAKESLPPFSSMMLIFCISADTVCSQPGAEMPFQITGLKGVASSGQMTLEGGAPREDRATLDRLDNGVIQIKVVETAGPGAGLTSIYKGTYTERRVTGLATFAWPGHAEDGKSATWAARIQDVRAKTPPEFLDGKFPKELPPTMIECENPPQCTIRGHWTFKGAHGTAVWNTTPPVAASLELKKWSPEGIEIKRSDITQPGWSTEYAATLQTGKVGMFSGTSSYDRNGQKSSGAWYGNFVSTSCKRADGLVPDEYQAETLAATAINFARMDDAIGCLKIAANAGMPMSTGMLSMIYAKGMFGVPKDPRQAFFWASKAAEAENYKGELLLSEFYRDGIGTPANPEKASFWADKAAASAEGKLDRNRKARQFTNSILDVLGAAVVTEFAKSQYCDVSTNVPFDHPEVNQARYKNCLENLDTK